MFKGNSGLPGLSLVFKPEPGRVSWSYSKNEWSPGARLAVPTTLDIRPKPYIKKPHKVLLYCTADFDGLRRDMSDFSQLFLSSGMDSRTWHVDRSWKCFKDALTSAINKQIPTRNSQVEMWPTMDLENLELLIKLELRRKDRRYRKARRTRFLIGLPTVNSDNTPNS